MTQSTIDPFHPQATPPAPIGSQAPAATINPFSFSQPSEIYVAPKPRPADPNQLVYPKLGNIRSRLVIITPIECKTFQKRPEFVGKDGETQAEMAIADIVVLEGEPLVLKDKDNVVQEPVAIPAEFPVMAFFNEALVGKIKGALLAEKTILGRIVRMPRTSDVMAGKYLDGDWPSVERDINAWIADGAVGLTPPFMWGIANYDKATDYPVATAYLNSKNEMPF